MLRQRVQTAGAIGAITEVDGTAGQITSSQLGTVVTVGLADTAVTPGGYGTASQVSTLTIDAKGRVTGAANTSIAIAASQVTSGQLALARGGTGADLSATGGANQVVRQSSVGGAFTVSALANADIPTALTGKTYNGLTITSTAGTLTIPNGGTLALSGAFSTTLTATNTTNVTLPTSGTLATLAGSETLSNKTLAVPTITTAAIINTATVTNRFVSYTTNGSLRWRLNVNGNSESGANAGSDFELNRYDDTGSLLAVSLGITRSNGTMSLGGAAGANCLTITPTASQNRWVTVTGSNGGDPTIGVSGGSLAISTGIVCTGAMNLRSATAVVAGGQSQLLCTSSAVGLYVGSGAPTVSAAKGSVYLRTDGSGINDRMYINTNGSTTWTAVVTVA